MKTKLKLLLITFTMFFTGNMYSQMTLTGEIRPRFESRHGYQSPLDSAVSGASFVSQRTRLNFGYKADKFLLGTSIQDVRIWGNVPQLIGADTIGQTFMHEAWGQYWFTPKFSLKTGRQELNYDDQRLLGGVNWKQQARVHDVAVFMYEDTASKFKVHIGAAFNQNGEANTLKKYSVKGNYKEMQYLWINKKISSLSASLIVINNGVQSPITDNKSRFSQTAGTYLEYNKDALFANGRFYYQTSKLYDKTNTSAYMFGVDVNYTLMKKITLGLGIEQMTGQSQTDTTKAYTDVNHAFNPLYGTAHKFNGYMDYYNAGNGHSNVGLTDIYFKAKYKAEKWYVGFDFHQFMAAAKVLDSKATATSGNITAMDSNLGMEIDLELGYNFSKQFSIVAGYSHYLLTQTTSTLKGVTDYKGDGYTGNTANWSYLMLVFKPNFMK